MSALGYVGLMLLAGLFFGRLTKLIGFPNVTGYIIAGLIMGPYILGIFPEKAVSDMNVVSEMALGFIALFIGAELKLSFLKDLGLSAIIITLFQGMLATVFVTAALLIFRVDFPLALILGAIASATAPAVTIMIIKQYRAKGPVTNMLIGVVALDDALALILFSVSVAVAKSTLTGSVNVLAPVVEPIIEIGISALLGVSLAILLLIPLYFFKKKSNRMCAIAGVIFVATSLSGYLGASSLLTCMIFGAALVNITRNATDVIEISEMMTPPILMLFFVLSGASLDIALIPKIGIIGAVYIIMRVLGKFSGSWLGAVIMKAPPVVRKYLGLTLLPQAGVAIGLTILVGQALPEYAGQVRTVILSATLIYELAGSVVSKAALAKAGEIESLPIKRKQSQAS